MEEISVLHMNKGVGDTSYAKNSLHQKELLSITMPFTKEALIDYFYASDLAPERMSIVDLGCSSGPNALTTISKIIDILYDIYRRRSCPFPELSMFLNDLPGNDFNTIFQSLPGFYSKLRVDKGKNFGPCMVAGVPGSFYGRLFPSKSLHFVHSSSSLHWLSQPPVGLDVKARPTLNKGNLYISRTSPEVVVKAYEDQFYKDFSVFIRSRAIEMTAGGRMVLSFMGRRTPDHVCDEATGPFELFSQALRTMIADGIVEEELLDSLNAPYYTPCPHEVIQVIQEDGSFSIHRFEMVAYEWDEGDQNAHDSRILTLSRGERISKTHRAVLEPMFSHHFGTTAMDILFQRYGDIVDEFLATKNTSRLTNFTLSVTRKSDSTHTQQ